MPGFFSPLADLTAWTLAPAGIVTPPAPLRYGGYPLLGVHATTVDPMTPASLAMPALGFLRKAMPPGAPLVIEIQVNPFPIRRVVTRLPFGCPTFYLIVPDDSGLVAFMDGDTATGMDDLGTATDVTIAMAGQDRIARHPAAWAALIGTAIADAAGTPDTWSDFQAALAALAPAGEPPVVVLDHTGAPRTTGSVRLVAGMDDLTLSLAAADGGDLQQTLARTNAARAHVFQGATSVTVATLPAGDQQLALVEDGSRAADQLTVPSTGGHVTATNLADWFAPQFAGGALARYTRGNSVRPFVNGREYFDDLFRELHRARNANGGLHLTGWSMQTDVDFTTRRDDDPPQLARKLKHAVAGIAADGGATCVLPARFLNVQDESSIQAIEIITFTVLTAGLIALRETDPIKTDAGGVIFATIGLFLNNILALILLTDDGRFLEPNKAAVDDLDALDSTVSRFAPYPAEIFDNPRAPSISAPWFTAIFRISRHFGIYHQSIAVVKRGAGDFVAYCGGMELNPNRLDDARHLIQQPFHDVQVRLEGPAVRDLAVTFEQRWTRDGQGAPAFALPSAASLGAPGTDVVQIGRTYFRAAEAVRALPFAAGGDRTISDTLVRAISAAREFIYIEDQYFAPPPVASDGLALPPPPGVRDALTAAVASGAIKRLVVTVPGVTNQPFGEIARTGFVSELMSADAGRGIVRVGYPRRHYTLPDNNLRASSGRCVLTEDMPGGGGSTSTVCLGPKKRLPSPPFWLAVDGELMYANTVVVTGPPAPDGSIRFGVIRGRATRLIKGGVSPEGTETSEHEAGAAATVVDLASVYVNAKVMIVDDVFLSVGSASLSRRGLFHDGEANAFTVPERLKAGADNPVRNLRVRLWAEMLDLSETVAAPLLADPVAATALFDRSPLLGNRYADISAYPERVVFNGIGAGGVFQLVLTTLGVTLAAGLTEGLFDGVIDPTSALEGP